MKAMPAVVVLRAALSAVVLLTLVVAAPAAAAPAPVSPTVSDALVRRYAPLLHLNTQERFLPANVTTFLRRSALLWSRPGPDARLADTGTIRPARMGARCARARLGCYRYRGTAADELTRPSGGRDAPGFYLAPDPVLYAGARDGAPLYWDVRSTRDGVEITYWAFYAYDEPVVEIETTLPTSDPESYAKLLAHEGDWERVVMLLSPALEPRGVRYHQHDGSRVVRWADVPREQGHPVSFVAGGKHGSFPTVGVSRECIVGNGRICIVDRRDRGRAIRSWRPGGLVPARAQPWYGFGGAWGRPGSLAATTGPLGPSRYKR